VPHFTKIGLLRFEKLQRVNVTNQQTCLIFQVKIIDDDDADDDDDDDDKRDELPLTWYIVLSRAYLGEEARAFHHLEVKKIVLIFNVKNMLKFEHF